MQQAANAKETTDEASELENLTLAINGAILVSDNYEVESNLLEIELANYFETGSYSVSNYADSGVIVSIGMRTYIVSTNGTISEFDDDWYGDGTSDTYYISTAIQLCELSDKVNNNEDTFEGETIYLTNDIDMNVAYGAGLIFEPIGSYPYFFEGTFNGNGFQISNFGKSENGAIGAMFSGMTSTVENLVISDSYFSCATFAGGLDEGGVIRNCSSLNNVISGTGSVGGIVGEADCGCLIECCINTSSISSTCSMTDSSRGVGGIVGVTIDAPGVDIYNCVNLGTINSSTSSGGIIGCAASGSADIYGSYNMGEVNGNIGGGIVGWETDGAYVYNCYNAGTISGTTVGGIVGLTTVYQTYYVDIQNSYSMGSYDLIGDTELSEASAGFTGTTVTNSENNIDETTMKSEAMIDLLNNNITSYTDYTYVQDTTGTINDGYPILSWQQ